MHKSRPSKSNLIFDILGVFFAVLLLAADMYELGKERHVYSFDQSGSQDYQEVTDVTRNKESFFEEPPDA